MSDDAEKVVACRIPQEAGKTYWVKDDGVWEASVGDRRELLGSSRLVFACPIHRERGYHYYLDTDGDVSRRRRGVDGSSYDGARAPRVEVLVTPTERATALRTLCSWAEEIRLVYAWASSSSGKADHWRCLPLNKVKRAVLGLHFAQTEPYVLRQLRDRGVLRVVLESAGVFHPKLLMATKGRETRVLLGSSNFTSGGFEGNTEVNVVLAGSPDDDAIQKLASFVDAQWNHPSAFEPDDRWFTAYGAAWAKKPAPPKLPPKTKPKKAVRGKASHETGIVEFHDHRKLVFHHEFQGWRTRHRRGFFLAFKTAGSALLHAATGCWHPGDAAWTYEESGASLTKKRKICGDNKDELLEWARKARVKVKACAHCF